MTRKGKLKVFRTSAGFEDAYIAAPSQKAALEAWGAKRNLFAQGAADVVTDPRLVEAVLGHKGQAMRVPRGTTAEHLMAAHNPQEDSAKRSISSLRNGAGHSAERTPPPNRAQRDAAQDRLDEARHEQQIEQAELARKIQALKSDLAKMKSRNAASIARLEADFERLDAAYREALSCWEG